MRNRKITDKEIIEQHIPIVTFIASVLGPNSEVALHDLSDIDHSIAVIINGHVTGREKGDGLMDFALRETFRKDAHKYDYVCNLKGAKTKEGEPLLFSSYYIRNQKDELIGIIAVNEKISLFEQLKEVADNKLSVLTDYSELDNNRDFNQLRSIQDFAENVFDNALNQLGLRRDNVSNFSKEERLKVLSIIDDSNLFSFKGMVKIIARNMDVSVPSVYRLLREIKDNGADKGMNV